MRGKNIFLAGLGWLALQPAAAGAQTAQDPAPNATATTNAVGPQELQNFSLSGKVTRAPDQQQATSSAATAPVPPTAGTGAEGSASAERPAPQTDGVARTTRRAALPSPPPVAKPKTADTGTFAAPSTAVPGGQGVAAPVQPAVEAQPSSVPAISSATPVLPPEHRLFLWPWLLAAAVLAAATLFLFWRRRHQEAFAGRGQFDLFVAPEPVPEPAPRPAPPKAAAPPALPQPPASPPVQPPRASSGIVSTRLRPTLELGVHPIRCIVDDDRVVLEFELEMFNSGTAPARGVLAEASLFNAGANQDQELGAFFAKPLGEGQPIEVIPPMQRMSFINQVVAPRAAIQEYELGGRKVFVPLLAFNATYAWSGGKAQSSAAYLVGRETAGEKLGPLSLEQVPREIGKLAGRPLPAAVRT